MSSDCDSQSWWNLIDKKVFDFDEIIVDETAIDDVVVDEMVVDEM